MAKGAVKKVVDKVVKATKNATRKATSNKCKDCNGTGLEGTGPMMERTSLCTKCVGSGRV